jgi:transposase InsO family protein
MAGSACAFPDRRRSAVCRKHCAYPRHRRLQNPASSRYVGGSRRKWRLGVTSHPTAEWIANQLTEACGWEQAPCYLIRDRDGAYSEIFIRRLRSMGIRDRPTSPRSPRQNAYVERLIGSIRRECVDHIIVLGERHLRRVLLSYMHTTMRYVRIYR